MKGGLAIMLHLARRLAQDPARHDATFVFYEGEEVADEHNGLRFLFAEHPELVAGDLAILLEPTGGWLEAGCQGAHPHPRGVRGQARPHRPPVDGRQRDPPRDAGARARWRLRTRGRGRRRPRVPRGAPGRAHQRWCCQQRRTRCLRARREPTHRARRGRSSERDHDCYELLGDADTLEVLSASAPAPPNLSHPLVQELIGAGVLGVRPKLGWTDVARFAATGSPRATSGPVIRSWLTPQPNAWSSTISCTAPVCSGAFLGLRAGA